MLGLIRTPSDLYEHAVAPLWLDLSISRGDDWNRACDVLIARLNEHRELLRQRLRRPIILALPAAYAQRLRELAPDLWSIRDFSLNLDDLELTGQQNGDAMSMAVSSSPSKPTVFDEAQWREWERLKKHGAKSRDVLRAGWLAADAALNARLLQRAEHVANDVLTLARELELAEGTDDKAATVRDLSISLDNVGDIAVAQGRLEDARGTYEESLELRRQQRDRLGETPETVRDLSISLDRVGDIARAQGRMEDAVTSFQEALIFWRRLNLAFPETQEYRDAIGDLEQRLAALQEAQEET